jgi:hypothetical protein
MSVSGAKTYSYVQRANLERRCTQLTLQAERIAAKYPGLVNGELLRLPKKRTTEALIEREAALIEALKTVPQVIRRIGAGQRMAVIGDELSRLGARPVELGDISLARASAGTASASQAGIRERLAPVAEMAAELEDPVVAGQLMDRAKALTGEEPEASERSLLALVQDAAQAVKAQRERHYYQDLAAGAALRIAGLDSPEAAAARAAAGQVEDAKALARYQITVDQLAAESAMEQVVELAREALTELGYQVDEPAEVLIAEAGAKEFGAHRPDLPAHALRVRVGGPKATLMTRVVAREATTTAEDIAAEEATCQDVYATAAALGRNGVELRAVLSRAAGEMPVLREERNETERQDEDHLAASRRARRQRPRQRERRS